MGRYYRLSKEITEEQKQETLRELRALRAVEYAEINRERDCLLIKTESEDYPDIMTKSLNIFNHTSEGCELRFKGFATC